MLPSAIRIEASSHCQLKCPSCPTTDGATLPAISKGLLRPAAFRRLLDDNPSIREVELSNYGEMFLNPWLAEILKLAFERKVEIIATNGVNFNHVKPRMLEALVRYRVRALTCSIDGASAATYRIYRKGGDFDRVIANIVALNALKVRERSRYPVLTWQFVVFGHNQHEIAAARAMARSLGMAFRVKLSWDEDLSPVRDTQELRAETGAASRAEYTANFGADYGGGICHQLWDAPQFNWDGALLGCCRNFWGDFGANVFELGLSSAVNSERMSHARAMLRGKAAPRTDIPCTQCEVYLGMAARNTWLSRGAFSRAGIQAVVRSLDRKVGSPLQRTLTRLCHARGR